MKKIAIVSSGYFPIPAVKGGAVETLIERLVESNEKKEICNFCVFSTYDEEAKLCNKFKKSKIIYINNNFIIENIDKVIYSIAKMLVKKDKNMSFRYILHRMWYIYKVAFILRNEDFDYVLIENTATLFWCLKLFNNRKKYKGKVLYHVHNEITSTFGCKKIINETKLFLGVSSYINKTIKNRLNINDETRFKILNNVVDYNNLRTFSIYGGEVRKKYGIKDSDILILYVGRLNKDKGISELIDAFVSMENINKKLMIVGNYYFGSNLTSEYEKELKNKIDSIGEKVIFTGFVDNNEIGSYYGAADIVALPSIWEEPAGLTIIESMVSTSGVTITTNSGGIPEYVGVENVVLLDKNSDDFINNLTNKIQYFSYKNVERKKMSNNAKEFAKKYDYQFYVERFYECIKGLENEKN